MYFGRLLSNWRRMFVALGVLMGCCGVSRAGTVTDLKFSGYPNGTTIPVTDTLSGTSANLNDGSSNITLHLAAIPGYSGSSGDGLNQGGAFGWTGGKFSGSDIPNSGVINPVPSDGVTAFSNTLVTFCLEINENISQNQTYTYNVGALSGAPVGGDPPMGQLAADYIAELWATNYAQAVSGDRVAAGAFQLAIWKLEYDTAMPLGTGVSSHGLTATLAGVSGADFSNGNLQVTDNTPGTKTTSNDSVLLAVQWLNLLTTPDGIAGDPNENMANVWALTQNGTQDQLIGSLVLPGGGSNVITVVPEPASIFMWLLISLAVGCVSLRRRQLAAAV